MKITANLKALVLDLFSNKRNTKSTNLPICRPVQPAESLPELTRKEQFLTFVFIGALSQDLAAKTDDAQEIAAIALSVCEEGIPENTQNAAKVFLAYCSGCTDKPFEWMLSPDPINGTKGSSRAESR
jgi:hypothetical protein